MSILAQIIGLACLLFWGFWLCCKLRLPAGFAFYDTRHCRL